VSLAHIINDLLDISRIESGRGFTLTKDFYNPVDIIRDVIPYFQENYKKHKFEVASLEEPVKLYVDKEKIEQVLKNLLSNAVKYSPEGGIIRVNGEGINDYYQVSVEDQGMGMTPEQVEKIFDKFYRVDASNIAIEGTGLGMTIVKYIVEAHEGKVWVESKLSKGTTVSFTIPL
jgi:signal transduction histidine kinase